MKKLILSLCFIAFAANTNAQIKTPQPSPASKTTQTVGLTEVTIEYSRPSMKGRTIFGDLVPYGKMWRTGANANTKITFNTDVTIAGKTLSEGTYAIFTTPNKDKWDVVFYTDASNWGTPKTWDDSKVALKTTVDVIPVPIKIETLTMTFDDLTNSSAVLGIMSENAYAGISFQVPTDKAVSKNIDKVMNGPNADDFYAAASYYYDAGKDINQAKTWINKAIELNKNAPKFWQLRKQSLILAKAGDKKAAIAAAKASLAAAEKANNAGYIKMNKEFLAKMK
jgi:hypothetical protein